MVKPKQKRVEEAKEALKLAEQSLLQKQASLDKVSHDKSIPFIFYSLKYIFWKGRGMTCLFR